MKSKGVLKGLGELALLAGVLWGLHWWTTPRQPRLPALPPPTWRGWSAKPTGPSSPGGCQGGPAPSEGELVDVSELLRRWGLE